ncbi:hypothetical protein ISG33_12690 [Glaciecola sp. MH2013]|uniref:hypothetical protein n=1 Tax=Glaciecola sp. MH2013 TaxID=2785524 RepID=UPI00189E39B4|nr:hypothetical protein [Glaciecola sp. MH2013]MBF7074256.1 hypothetical protein [Glaciecola sp. MH2013]
MMVNRFYALTKSQQVLTQIKLALALFFIFALICALSWLFISPINALFVSIGCFAILLLLYAPFVDVPSGIAQGSLRYLSPFLLAEKEKNNLIVLHGASLFDYFFCFDKEMPAEYRKSEVYKGFIRGLLELISEFEKEQLHLSESSLKVKTTSYIINPRSAQKFGLVQVPTDGLQRVILYLNYISLFVSLSLLNKKPSFPNLKRIYSFEAKLADMAKKKDYLQTLLQKLSN